MISNSEDLNKYYKIINELVDNYVEKHKIKPSRLINYLSPGSDRFKKFTDYFEESFAQLLTHKFCNNNSKKYCSVFNTLKTGQSREYTIYGEIDNSLGGSLKQCPKSILENIFFGKNLEEEKEKIGDSTAEKYFFELFEKPVLEYCEIEYTNKEIFDGADFETRKDLIELGLVYFAKLNQIDSSFYFISEDPCSK